MSSICKAAACLIAFLLTHSIPIKAADTIKFRPNQINELSEHPEWLKLLHIRKNALTSQFESYIDDPGFFLAESGHNNPKAELVATLTAMNNDSADIQQTLCRFPARSSWIYNQLAFPLEQRPKINCPEYQKWRTELNAESIHLIFASAYLNSPSSMFGHTLLRLDSTAGAKHSDWLSYALNFGAIVDEQDNSILYAFKGIAGGYTGLFQLMQYFKKIQEYSFMENRDLWEYRLNLTPEETERLMAHLWELKDVKFDYFFVSENCSFRLLELLEIARPGSRLTDSFVLTAIPSEIIQATAEQGFIESRQYRPSQLTELKQQLKNIPEPLHHYVLDLAENKLTAHFSEFKALSIDQQKQITAAAYQLVRYRTADQGRTAKSVQHRFKLLKQLNSYPLTPTHAAPVTQPSAPETGHKTRVASVAAGYQDDKAYTELSYRQNYHDLLDNPDGYFQGAAINFFNANLRIYEDNRFRLQNLELLGITSLSPRDLFFQPISWRMSAGVGYQDYEHDKLSVYLNAGGGLSYSWFSDSLSYGFINAHIEHNANFEYPLEPGIGMTLGHLQYSGFGTSQFEFDAKIFVDGSYLYNIGLGHNFVLSQNQALRLSIKHHWNSTENFNQAQLAYRLYF